MFDPARFQTLLQAYVDLELTGAERAEFELMLLSSARAREMFWTGTRLHALACDWGREEIGRRVAAGLPAADFPQQRGVGATRAWWWGAAALTAVVALGFLSGVWLRPSRPSIPAAFLAASSSAQWAEGLPAPTEGEPLPAQPLRLVSGKVRVDFYSGAQIWLEGPAEIRLMSPLALELQSGRLRARVPEAARGFTIHTENLTVVDHGTEFGVAVAKGRPSEVHVFEGRVEVRHPSNPSRKRVLGAGQALRAQEQQWSAIRAQAKAFPDQGRVSGPPGSPPPGSPADEAARTAQMDAWREAAERLSKDPDTRVHYLFEPRKDGKLRNAASNAPEGSDGVVIGCQWVAGRWPGKQALSFNIPYSRAPVAVSEEMTAVTFLAWLRLDSLPTKTNRLYHPYHTKPGALFWSIDPQGRLGLGLFTGLKEFTIPDTKLRNQWDIQVGAPVLGDHVQQWVHVASVYDSTSRRVWHYLNGRPVGGSLVKYPLTVKFEPGQLGAATSPNGSHPMPDEYGYARVSTNPLRARMDEFAIVARAMTAREIRELYESGQQED